jgi:hypothetical protein
MIKKPKRSDSLNNDTSARHSDGYKRARHWSPNMMSSLSMMMDQHRDDELSADELRIREVGTVGTMYHLMWHKPET